MKISKDWLFIGGLLALAYFVGKKRFGLGEIAENLDVSRNEDLAGGCAHLISIEEHLASSYATTGDQAYIDQLEDARKMRREAMSLLLPPDAPGENWCLTKHFLCGSMRMAETGAKLMNEGDRDGAGRCFQMSKQMKDRALAVASTKSNAAQCSVCQNG